MSEYFPVRNGESFNIFPSVSCHKCHASQRLISQLSMERMRMCRECLEGGALMRKFCRAQGNEPQVHPPLPDSTPNFIQLSTHPP